MGYRWAPPPPPAPGEKRFAETLADSRRLDWLEGHRVLVLYQPPRPDDGGGEGWLISSVDAHGILAHGRTLRDAIDKAIVEEGERRRFD